MSLKCGAGELNAERWDQAPPRRISFCHHHILTTFAQRCIASLQSRALLVEHSQTYSALGFHSGHFGDACTPSTRTNTLKNYAKSRRTAPHLLLLSNLRRRGLSVEELKTKIKLEQDELKRQQRRESAPTRSPTEKDQPVVGGIRKDSSPVKPLSSILNIPRILATPHTPEQISALWTVYHASRSNGTGRGYLCAAIPFELYTKMASTAAKYPLFVVPVRRDKDPAALPVLGEADAAHEFYFLQWSFHEAPPIPSANDDLFAPPTAVNSSSSEANPQTSTVMFTPLQEYKLRESFATPYLVLTNYTDLAQSHGIVLLRGDITPSAAAGSAGVDGRYLLRQEDAHRLSMSVQNFYLWDATAGDESLERQKMVKAFHENQDAFSWEELLKHAV